MAIPGALGCALVDTHTGFCLGERGGGDVPSRAKRQAERLREEMRSRRASGNGDPLVDLVIPESGGARCHLLRMVSGWSGALFLYVELEGAADVERARQRAGEIARGMVGN